MRKLLFVFVCVLVVFCLASCKSTDSTQYGEPIIDVTVDGEDVAKVTIVPDFNDGGLFTGIVGTKGYSLMVENKTDSIIKIVWEKSAVYYEGNSSLPFITGQKYIDHNSPMSPTIIPPKGKNTTGVYSADQVLYYKGWFMKNIPTFDTKVIICIEANGKDSYYTFTIQRLLITE